MCSIYDVRDRRHYTRSCPNVTKELTDRDRGWKSQELKTYYDGICNYYPK
jgi:hypothetical protein